MTDKEKTYESYNKIIQDLHRIKNFASTSLELNQAITTISPSKTTIPSYLHPYREIKNRRASKGVESSDGIKGKNYTGVKLYRKGRLNNN